MADIDIDTDVAHIRGRYIREDSLFRENTVEVGL